jgi:hypothetical protein
MRAVSWPTTKPRIEQPDIAPKEEFEPMKTEVTIQLAQVILQCGQASEEERNAATGMAGGEGATPQNYSCAHPYLRATNGNTGQAAEWQDEVGEEFGDYYDNAAALTIIRYQLAHGEVIVGLTRACHLREFINQHRDEKSVHCLIPEIEAVIAQYRR